MPHKSKVSHGVVVSTLAFKPTDHGFESWSIQEIFYFFFFLKWDKKWAYWRISFSEREKKVKLALIDFRGLAISSRFSSFLGLLSKFLYIFGNPGLLCAVPAKAKADIARAFNLSRCNCVLTLTWEKCVFLLRYLEIISSNQL